MEEQRIHRGGCHCKSVSFEFQAPANLVAWDCNCELLAAALLQAGSICSMKRNTHTIVPAAQFRLLSGEDNLSCYQFGTKTAKHLFCSTCGICSHYIPRSNPDGIAITVHCIEPGTVDSVTVERYEGKDWEQAYAATGIASCSERQDQSS